MFEGLFTVNFFTFTLVFIEGIVSFFSPCVIPLIPIYMSYLAGNTKHAGDGGEIIYNKKKVFFHTIFFILGISFAFFILGMTFSAIGSYFSNNQMIFTRLGGILIILLGLFQFGFFEFKFLQKEKKFKLDLSKKEVNPVIAFFMGFTFSFAWTPCVGPALSSVLILASSAQNTMLGNFLVLLYAVGFVIPFLLLGLFTTQALNFLKRNQRFLQYTVKVGGVILIIIGIMTFSGWMNGISRYLNSYSPNPSTVGEENSNRNNRNETDVEDSNSKSRSRRNLTPAYDFTLLDQYGNEHRLSDYQGKVVFLNFWATWCPPCRKEMPDIERIYQEYNFNQDEVVILGVANPTSKEYPFNQDVSQEEIISFLDEYELTFPTVFDVTGEVFRKYSISAFPTTFMIDKDGNIYGFVPGMLTRDMMKNIIQETLDSSN